MYDRFKNQYIFKLSSGKMINYYYKENTGICANTINRRNLWSDSVILAKDCLRGFSADIDKNDKINILYQDTNGNLYAVRYANAQYKTSKLLTSKNVTAYDKNLKLITQNDTNFYLYVVEHNGCKLLSYQSSNKDLIFSSPKAIDFCSDSLLPYTAFRDNNGNVVVFYFSEESKRKNPGIRIINCINDTVGDFVTVSDYSSDILILGGLCDQNGNYNLLWERKKEDKYELCYSYKFKDKDKFETEKVINSSMFSHINSSIAEKGNAIICYWILSDTIYYSTSLDHTYFSNPEIYKQFDGRQYYCISYKENTSLRSHAINAETLPINFSNGLHLGFSDTNPEKVLERSSNTLQAYSRNRLDEYDAKYKALEDKVDSLIKKITQYELDTQKALIRLTQLETDFNKKIKVSKTKLMDEDLHMNKTYQNPEDIAIEKFKHMENKLNDNDFIQDPKIEEIKKQIALQSQKSEKVNDSKDNSDTIAKFKSQTLNNSPIMQGSGFSSITAEYLKNLGKKHE